MCVAQIVEMVKEYIHVSENDRNETIELERLAGQLSLSETHQQVREREGGREGGREVCVCAHVCVISLV